MGCGDQRYLVALGSNQRHVRHGAPAHVLRAALAALEGRGIAVLAAGPITDSAPIGPSLRRYANSAALVACRLEPFDLLATLKAVERDFGRRAGGQRWRSRVLDIDIVLWSGGAWSGPGLVIPHPEFRNRHFVLVPALALAATWRDPLSGLTLRQLHARLTRRLTRPRPIPR